VLQQPALQPLRLRPLQSRIQENRVNEIRADRITLISVKPGALDRLPPLPRYRLAIRSVSSYRPSVVPALWWQKTLYPLIPVRTKRRRSR
jgi:hypothetical protein